MLSDDVLKGRYRNSLWAVAGIVLAGVIVAMPISLLPIPRFILPLCGGVVALATLKVIYTYTVKAVSAVTATELDAYLYQSEEYPVEMEWIVPTSIPGTFLALHEPSNAVVVIEMPRGRYVVYGEDARPVVALGVRELHGLLNGSENREM